MKSQAELEAYRKACDDCGRKILKLEAQVKAEQARLRALDDILRERTEERDHLGERAKDLHESLVEIRKADQAEIDVLKKRLAALETKPDELAAAYRDKWRLEAELLTARSAAVRALERSNEVVDAVVAGLLRKVTG
jgi:chromosome segregation ATPase